MSTLSIRLFGGVRANLDDRPLGSFPTRWAAGLLGYLALDRGRMLHRDILAATFWPEESDARARKALRNALWRLRARVEPKEVEPGSFLVVEGQTVGLRSGPAIRIDVEEFEILVRGVSARAGGPEALDRLEGAVDLYRGDFMDGHDHQWCVYERQRLQLALLSSLERLMDGHMTRGEWRAAVARGEAILHRDPLREHVHRRIMLCHHGMGDRPLAIRQYRVCEEILREELGIVPMAETRRLYEHLQTGEGPGPEGMPEGPGLDPRLYRALGQAETALLEIRSLTRRRPRTKGLERTV